MKPFSTTGIGSLPHTDPEEAVSIVLDTFDIPFWPQLPALSFRELMIPQYAEGMPGLRVDEARQRIWVERDEEEIARFYEGHTAEDAKDAISEEHSRGLYAFLKMLRGKHGFVKGQITGPLTFALGISDLSGRPVYFDEELREISLMLLKAKARWQVDILSPHAKKVIIFIDEPILSALGSTSYMGVSRQETLRLLRETAGAIKAAGAISAIHCCGRADWQLVLDTGVDILNFDAFGFGDTLAIYPAEVTTFLESGGYLAWGIVPTLDTEALNSATEESILGVFRERLEALSREIPRDILLKNIIITPSCGTGSRSRPEVKKIFHLLGRLKDVLS